MSERRRRERRREARERRANYQPAVLRAAERAMADGSIRPGQVYVLPVRHDGWCALLNNKGGCNCNPQVGAPERVPSPDEN